MKRHGVMSNILDDRMLYEILTHDQHVESQDARKSTCQGVFCIGLSVIDHKPALGTLVLVLILTKFDRYFQKITQLTKYQTFL